MATDAGCGDDGFVVRLSGLFAREVFQPMFQRAPAAPGDIRQLIGEFREKLDALDLVIRTCPGDAAHLRLLERRQHWPNGQLNNQQSNRNAEPEPETYDDIGRNQRSRLRELTLLEAMSRETRAYSLQQLMTALDAKGFGDTSAAVVSQLHRLKKLGVVNQPANGMYEITTEGLGHLRKLRTSFGALLSG